MEGKIQEKLKNMRISVESTKKRTPMTCKEVYEYIKRNELIRNELDIDDKEIKLEKYESNRGPLYNVRINNSMFKMACRTHGIVIKQSIFDKDKFDISANVVFMKGFSTLYAKLFALFMQLIFSEVEGENYTMDDGANMMDKWGEKVYDGTFYCSLNSIKIYFTNKLNKLGFDFPFIENIEESLSIKKDTNPSSPEVSSVLEGKKLHTVVCITGIGNVGANSFKMKLKIDSINLNQYIKITDLSNPNLTLDIKSFEEGDEVEEE